MRIFPRFSHTKQLLVVGMSLCFLAVAVPGFGANLAASPTTINYGTTPVNSGPFYNVTLTNKSGGTARISWAGASGGQATSFKVAGPAVPFSLAQGKSVSFQVKFTPKTTGTFATTFSVFSTNSLRVEVPLKGVATSGTTTGGTGGTTTTKGTLGISPSTLSFGNVTVGVSSSKTVTLTASTASVQISNATTSNQEFTISGLTLPATIAVGQSISVSVNFKPTASGSTSTQLSLTDNGVTSPGVITASGAGVATTQHTVALAWSPSTSSVPGYDVYRGTASGGPYSKIASAIVTTSYSDAAVASGSTYFYVTTAVNSSGIESANSNEVKAIIPTP